MSFKSIQPSKIEENVFDLIGNTWMLITAANGEKVNTMTASWGGLGVLWAKKVAFCVIRPQRYTLEFIEKNDYYTLSFLPEQYRDALNLLGKKSGRDCDKITESGLTVIRGENNTAYFEESKIILKMKKLYYQDLNPDNFIAPELQKIYPNKDYHRMYIGEIENCLIKK